jgi:hypothetical protein
MDPYTLHEMQRAGAFDPRPEDAPADLFELLLDAFVATPEGRQVVDSPSHREALIGFLVNCRRYMLANPVVGQGMLAGGLTLVLRDGESVPLVVPDNVGTVDRPGMTYAVTRPRETHMKGFQGRDSGPIGVTGRDPRR